MLHYVVTLTFDLLTLESCHVMPRGTWVVNPCTKFEVDKTYRSGARKTTIFHWSQLKVPIFTFFGS